MKSIVRGGALSGAMLALVACGSFGGKGEGGAVAAPSSSPRTDQVTDGPTVLGPSFTIGTTSYTPADIPDYDDVGYAGRFAADRAGQATANGETFDPAAITAAHKTLPLPSYVEVTALDTGRTILVRVNDRGPMVSDRLIELSPAAADQLGLRDNIAAVRVRRTNPPAAERAQLRMGRAVPERIATPDSLLAILRRKLKEVPVPSQLTAQPKAPTPTASAGVKPGTDRFIVEGEGAKSAPETKPVPQSKPAPKAADATAAKPAPATNASLFVQVGAFSTQARAEAAAKMVGGSVSKGGSLWRVRTGPFTDKAQAETARADARAKGFRDAVVVRDR